MKVLLHIYHHNLLQLTEDDTLSWLDLFNQHHEMIEAESIDLLDPSINNLDDKSDDEESDLDQKELDDEDQLRSDWMILSEMRPSAAMEISLDLGSRNID